MYSSRRVVRKLNRKNHYALVLCGELIWVRVIRWGYLLSLLQMMRVNVTELESPHHASSICASYHWWTKDSSRGLKQIVLLWFDKHNVRHKLSNYSVFIKYPFQEDNVIINQVCKAKSSHGWVIGYSNRANFSNERPVHSKWHAGQMLPKCKISEAQEFFSRSGLCTRRSISFDKIQKLPLISCYFYLELFGAVSFKNLRILTAYQHFKEFILRN